MAAGRRRPRRRAATHLAEARRLINAGRAAQTRSSCCRSVTATATPRCSADRPAARRRLLPCRRSRARDRAAGAGRRTACLPDRSSAAKRTRSSACRSSSPGASRTPSRASRPRARWAADNLELGYVLAQAYVQTRQPDARACSRSPRLFGVAARFRRRASDRRADDDSARDGAAAEAELTQAPSRRIRSCRGANLLLGQIAMFRGRLDEAIALTERELAFNPAQRDGVLAARRRARAAVEVGRGDRGAAEIDLAESRSTARRTSCWAAPT